MEEKKSEKISCEGINAKNQWAIGFAVVVIVTIFSIAMFKTRDTSLDNPVGFNRDLPAPYQGSQEFLGLGQTVAFNQGAIPPGCATCPNLVQCFPQASPAQPVAFGVGLSRCPFCRFNFNSPQAGPNGMPMCPRCLRNLPAAIGNNNLTPVAFNLPPLFSNKGVLASPIFRDAVMLHEYRGVCSNCHLIKSDIPIPTNAQMPHEYRGVCSNCHKILGMLSGAR